MSMRFPFTKQIDLMDCGPTCLHMIAKWYGQNYPLSYLRERCFLKKEGASLLGLSEGAESIGFRTLMVKLPFRGDEFSDGLVDVPLPCIVHWRDSHYVVVYKISKKYVWIADPSAGKLRISHNHFKETWLGYTDKGIALCMEVTPQFYDLDDSVNRKIGWSFFANYLRQYKRLGLQLLLGLILVTVFQSLAPFLTQAIVDIGIQQKNLSFIYLILIAQLTLFVSQSTVSFIQRWIMLQIGSRLNIGMVADFIGKLMKLPIGLFDTKLVGDLSQRIADNDRIEHFLTQSVVSVFFSFFSVLVFGGILFIYDPLIFAFFAFFSVLYFLWIRIFMKKRREIDYLRFQKMGENQQSVYELINGMQEIKLQGSENRRKWKWINTQAQLFRVKIKSLTLGQYQEFGAGFINQFKNILITFYTAKLALDGQLTIGMMMAVQYIVGQLNMPFQQFIDFTVAAQDARISLERMNDIHGEPDEDVDTPSDNHEIIGNKPNVLLENLSFRYSQIDDFVLRNINIEIPYGKTTAIVGMSGSGKSTLLKLLLGFYAPTEGQIKIGGVDLQLLNKKGWRKKCGTVMQDGFIFSDTIANNISESDTHVDIQKLHQAVDIANIREYIEHLAKSYFTKIGPSGIGLSQGQRQRLLIARAVYKNPDFLFLDEATNALDSNNERAIIENLHRFFKEKTVVVVAHRLSTVKRADQIIVLDQGSIVEIGTHQELVRKQGEYFKLVKNQLELG